jgi:hypothetical protein
LMAFLTSLEEDPSFPAAPKKSDLPDILL